MVPHACKCLVSLDLEQVKLSTSLVESVFMSTAKSYSQMKEEWIDGCYGWRWRNEVDVNQNMQRFGG